jgi:chemotaxis family two-component system response regulator PixH
MDNSLFSEELFIQYVKDALNNLHDTVRLQNSPLLDVLQLDTVPGGTDTASLRELLRDSIEALRPPADLPLDSREWGRYRLLLLRFVRRYSLYETCQELAISASSYYRYQQEAIEALARLLWERYQPRQAPPIPPNAAKMQTNLDARQRAIRLAYETRHSTVEMQTVLDGARRIILPLAAQRGVTLHLDAPATLPAVSGDPVLLRQVVLSILTESIALVRGQTLHVQVSVVGDRIECRVWDLDASQISQESLAHAPDLDLARGLIQVYGGRLRVVQESPGLAELVFVLPVTRPKTVLVIDDDVDTVRLYQLYLQAHRFAVRTAYSADELRARLGEGEPDLILLDVLMPSEGGWDVLEYLKSDPATSAIPIVICSVLSDPALALAMGAAEVLCKPIHEETLISTVRRVLGEQGNLV